MREFLAYSLDREPRSLAFLDEVRAGRRQAPAGRGHASPPAGPIVDRRVEPRTGPRHRRISGDPIVAATDAVPVSGAVLVAAIDRRLARGRPPVRAATLLVCGTASVRRRPRLAQRDARRRAYRGRDQSPWQLHIELSDDRRTAHADRRWRAVAASSWRASIGERSIARPARGCAQPIAALTVVRTGRACDAFLERSDRVPPPTRDARPRALTRSATTGATADRAPSTG